MSKLLLDEPPLIVLPTLADAIGLNESIFIQQLQYWINIKTIELKNEKDKAQRDFLIERHYFDNKIWIYNSFESWQSQFKFWSISTIKRIVKSLKEQKLINTRRSRQSFGNPTLYYCINYEVLNDTIDEVNLTSTECQPDTIDEVNMTPSYNKEEHRLHTETTTEIKNYNKKEFDNLGVKYKYDPISGYWFHPITLEIVKVISDIEPEDNSINKKESNVKTKLFTQELFDSIFWPASYRKVNRTASLKAFLALNKPKPLNNYKPSQDGLKLIMEKWISHNNSWKREKKDKSFVPHASTWLNNQRWNDEVEQANNNQTDYKEESEKLNNIFSQTLEDLKKYKVFSIGMIRCGVISIDGNNVTYTQSGKQDTRSIRALVEILGIKVIKS